MYNFFFSRWVHIVCALYVPGVAFGDIDKLRPVTLTEMNYSKYGAKVSTNQDYAQGTPNRQIRTPLIMALSDLQFLKLILPDFSELSIEDHLDQAGPIKQSPCWQHSTRCM